MSNGPMDDPRGVPIGRAAALYGLSPSTLRWWESRGALPEPARADGHRVYTEDDLRRIGLAYLCHVTGAMTLDQTSDVTSGDRDRRWQETVRGHVGEIEERIRRLEGARGYLLHLLRCPDDDIVARCPDLDGELAAHTPRGRVAARDIVAAARSVPAGREVRDIRNGLNGRDERDGTGPARDEKGGATGSCSVCAAPFTRSVRGRPREYCSRACRQRRYRRSADRDPA